jgi:UDP-2,4-diacetamido-2,4,6-trideoxy-beta-L-altropyranose hydrolase
MAGIVFRVDASFQIGSGHVARCLTLADRLRDDGAKCRFIHRLHPGHLVDVIRARGYAVAELPAPSQFASGYQQWLGTSQHQDASETIAALAGESADWLVVDHYGLDAHWEQALRPHAVNIAVLDDLADRPHDCDLLVDQNYQPDGERRYDGLLPERSRRLCGTRYALLRREYAAARRTVGPRRGPVSRVLVFYGGVDAHNETGRALRALSRPGLDHIFVDVVVGAKNPHRRALLELAAAGLANTWWTL